MTTVINPSIDYTKFAAKSWTEKMDICNDCNCCECHNINKPSYVLPTVHDFDCIDVLDTTTEVWGLGLCKCKCRFLARRMCEEDNFEIMTASPSPSELPPPPQRWLAKDPTMDLLDAATDEALEHYWAGQVKACQYAIFHIC
jgi:hypothetical protein